MAQAKQIGLRLPEELLQRVDEMRGDIPRERWIRRLIERAADTSPRHKAQSGSDVTRIISSAQAKSTVVPVPKGGKTGKR